MGKKNEIKVSERDLRQIKRRALDNYLNKHHLGLEAEAFWGKCALEASLSVLELDINITYPDDRGYKKRDK